MNEIIKLLVLSPFFLLFVLQNGWAAEKELNCLITAYPQFLSKSSDLRSNQIVWLDGTVMSYSDGIEHTSLEDRLNFADLKDQLSIPYPLGQSH